MFFEDTDQVLYPVSRITAIRPDGHHFRVELTEGHTVTVRAAAMDRMMRQPSHILPVQAETFVLNMNEFGETGPYTTPVIAWSVGFDGRLYPITTDGINDGLEGDLFIQRPDGKITRADDCEWHNLEALENYLAEMAAIEHRLRA